MRERKKTGVHGTLTYSAVKFNFQQILPKTLIPTMNTLKDTAVLNVVKTDGKWAPEGKREGLELIQMCFSPLFSISHNFVKRNLILGRILRKLALQGGTLGYKKNEPVWPKSQKSTRILPKAWGSLSTLKIFGKKWSFFFARGREKSCALFRSPFVPPYRGIIGVVCIQTLKSKGSDKILELLLLWAAPGPTKKKLKITPRT